MPVITLQKGTIRDENPSFIPKSMIDMLFDYGKFLHLADEKGAIAVGPDIPKTIAIIGAGASGLVSAYELSRISNITINIFEASDKVGGRMDSVVIQDPGHNPKIFELGCMRYPPTSYTLFHYLNKFDLKTIGQFPDPGKVATILFYENSRIQWPIGSPTPNSYDFQRIGTDFGNIMKYLIGDPNNPDVTQPSKLIDYWAIYQNNENQYNKNNVINAWQQIIDSYRNVSYYDAIYELSQNTELVQQPWTIEDINKFGALGVGSGGFSPLFQVNFVEIIRIILNGWEHKQQFLEKGITHLAQSLEKAVLANGQNTISMNSKVRRINKTQLGKYILTFDDQSSSNFYDAVIVATTTRAMEYMGLTSDGRVFNGRLMNSILTQSQKVALRNLHHMNSSKLFVTTKTKFWYKENNERNEDLPSNIQTDELMRGLYCLDYDIGTNNNENRNFMGMGVVLISYVWGDDSSKLLGLTPEERLDQFKDVISQIDQLFAKLLYEQAENVTCIDWETESNYYGAFKLNYPGQEYLNHSAFFQFQDMNQGVFLAGDSVSWAGGWLEGTMSTAVNAACAAAKYCGASLMPNSPLDDISKDMFRYI